MPDITITYYTHMFINIMQAQPPEVFYKKGVLKYFSKFTGKQLHQSLFFSNVGLGLQLYLKRDSGIDVFL